MYKNSSSSLVHIRVGQGLEGRDSLGVTDGHSDTSSLGPESRLFNTLARVTSSRADLLRELARPRNVTNATATGR